MKRMLSAVALAAAALGTSVPASAAIVVSFNPAQSTIAIGETVEVEMNISGLGDEILSAFDIDLLFDAFVENFSVAHNVALQWPGGLGEFGPSVFGVGRTSVTDYSWELDDDVIADMQANSFTVLTFGFRGVANGAATLRLGPDVDLERNFVGRAAETLAVQVGTACIAVGTGTCDDNQVPEPASYGLAGLALLAAGAARRRRREGQGD